MSNTKQSGIVVALYISSIITFAATMIVVLIFMGCFKPEGDCGKMIYTCAGSPRDVIAWIVVVDVIAWIVVVDVIAWIGVIVVCAVKATRNKKDVKP